MKFNILILLCVFCYNLHAQNKDTKRDYTWCLGSADKTIINFSTSSFTQHLVNSSIYIQNSNASISDTAGNLLFYTNGFKIINKNHTIMENGDSLNCCTSYFQDGMQTGFGSPQGALILPKPDSPNIYYVFHSPLETLSSPPYFQYSPMLYSSVVDMSMNNGIGKVIQKNISIITDTLQIGLLTACRHANGRDWWLLLREYESNRFRTLLLTPTGIENHGIQVVGVPFAQQSYGQSLFSPDGTKYIMAQMGVQSDNFYYAIYDFDRCTGLLSAEQTAFVYSPGTYLGCAVSASSECIYFATYDSVFQYKLKDANIASTKKLVANWVYFVDSLNNGYGFGFMTLAPDDKIYMYGGLFYYLNTINNPDLDGIACNIEHHNISIL